MKIYTYYTDSHKIFHDNYFKKTLPSELTLVDTYGTQECQSGSYYDSGWGLTTGKKIDVFIQAVKENMGGYFIFSDVDIQVFGNNKDTLINELGDHDIAAQNDYFGGYCSGFFISKGNERTLNMFTQMKNNYSSYLEDQDALNKNINLCKSKLLSNKFWTVGIEIKQQWNGQDFNIPNDILMHHANWTVGIQNKTNLLNKVREKFNNKIGHISTISN